MALTSLGMSIAKFEKKDVGSEERERGKSFPIGKEKVEITQAQKIQNLFADRLGNPSLVGRRRRMDILPFSVEDHRERKKTGKRNAEFYL